MINSIAEPQAAKLVIGNILLWSGGAAAAIIVGMHMQGYALGRVAEFAVLGSVIYLNPAEIRRALGPIRRAWVMLPFALWFVLPLFGKPIVGTLNLRMVIVSLAVPVVEELFFRGWIWSELRKIWPIWATMLDYSGTCTVTRRLCNRLGFSGVCAVSRVSDIGGDLDAWLAPFLGVIGRSTRSKWAPLYVQGSLGPDGPKVCSRSPPGLGLLATTSSTISSAVRSGIDTPLWRVLAEQADRLVGGDDAVLVIDDTALPKKGTVSVGVAGQYCGVLAARTGQSWCR